MPIRVLLSLSATALLLAAGATGALAGAAMQSTKLAPKLCETTGGGKFVSIPGFPGERIDRRLIADIRWLVRRYSIFVTDGYSTSDVHAWNGEHPVGLALDIVPDKAAGGTWADVTRLARWAEPRQDQTRAPFRWVGYDGDAGHGRGHHLHLSWNHSASRAKRPARTVYTIRCPGSSPASAGSEPQPPEPDSSTGGIGGQKLAPITPETGGVQAPRT
jgi:hypothetical protein